MTMAFKVKEKIDHSFCTVNSRSKGTGIVFVCIPSVEVCKTLHKCMVGSVLSIRILPFK